MSHTPGPWKHQTCYGSHWICAGRGCNGIEIATLFEEDSCEDTLRANALLIAAAPDLLLAIEILLRETDMGTQHCDAQFAHAAQAAIAKAKGET